MILTNNKNLPEAIVSAIQNDPYSKQGADFSVTELIKPPRIRALELKHKSDITEDVSDRLWSLYGQIGHGILERANMADLAEKRFFANIEVSHDDHIKTYVLSGQLDTLSLKDNTLSDYKFTTSWSFMANKEPKPEYVAQLNMQNYLLNVNGLKAEKLQIVGLLRDWQILQAKKNKDYPQVQIAIQPIPMWSFEETENYIKERVRLHLEALSVLPECDKDDHWGWKRCASYCSASAYCEQYKTKKEVKL